MLIFALVMETKRKGYIEQLITQGEHVHQDFKYQITDARKIARSISAFANNSGGHLLVGVKDNGSIVGVSSDEEIYMIEQAAQMYCQPEQQVKFEVFRVAGKNVLKVDIDEAKTKPVKAPDDNGHWRTYYRVADENVLASSTHVKVMKSTITAVPQDVVINLTEKEELLLDYLQSHGGITMSGYERLAHISFFIAQRTVVKLCEMGIVELQYHNGQCVITSTKE
ncbi:MAG: ATP-binding protein [Muribaculaceae bacterium]|nr:ATP-binding protein [Muribaculaceae bacterium]